MCKWFRFSIRDVLWLTVVVALAVAWYARERKFRAVFDERLVLIKEVLSIRYQLAQERISGLQAEKAELEEAIQELKGDQLRAGYHLDQLLYVRKKLEAENKALAAESAAAMKGADDDK
jgi:hypothetical protein